MRSRASDFNFKVNPEAAASFHDDGVVILHVGKGSLFSANRTGARIWRGVEHQRSLESIVDDVSGEYQIARTTARMHTLDFLTALERQSLIQREVAS
jgi:UDP-N-acetylglucosamine transferase subunit ALG13